MFSPPAASLPAAAMSDRGGCGSMTLSEVQQLVRRKDELEAQIRACYQLLDDQKGVGMDGPLVDSEGFPRADIDLYQVRTARHNIACLQNDHKALMKQVEEALHQLHAREKEKHARDEAEARAEAMSQNLPTAFAKVNVVTPESPASIAGLQVDDEIVEFGSVNANNFKSLQNIATVVQHSEGLQYHSIAKMTTAGKTIKMKLVPAFWTLI
ncbi:26S proteasome non-ATPase regulatory subunit 9 isoform X2 [Coturnix japonica]|uniref:26S proteasome non-ATPase regulatory subunit 9 isoform X2 n=1 Tax=Coturnix japonica TaxID=93934 RepID=UPI000776C0BA|nr:26S proteasome non-ATPase regulatory subunit 9 isoform X2 [Coturnix japonica]